MRKDDTHTHTYIHMHIASPTAIRQPERHIEHGANIAMVAYMMMIII